MNWDIPFHILLIAAEHGNVRMVSLLSGLASVAVGIALILSHRQALDQAVSDADGRRGERFELRKFRRRSLVGSLIASMGIMLSGLYWVTNVRVYAAFILMILCLLGGILLIAIVDFFSVGIHSLTATRGEDPKALLEEYLQRKKERKLGDRK